LSEMKHVCIQISFFWSMANSYLFVVIQNTRCLVKIFHNEVKINSMLLYAICKVKPLNIYFNQSFKNRKTAIFISPNIPLKVNKNSAFIVLYYNF
jgi:hypothetical protein